MSVPEVLRPYIRGSPEFFEYTKDLPKDSTSLKVKGKTDKGPKPKIPPPAHAAAAEEGANKDQKSKTRPPPPPAPADDGTDGGTDEAKDKMEKLQV